MLLQPMQISYYDYNAHSSINTTNINKERMYLTTDYTVSRHFYPVWPTSLSMKPTSKATPQKQQQ